MPGWRRCARIVDGVARTCVVAVAALHAAEGTLASLTEFDEETLDKILRRKAEDLGLSAGQFFGCIRVACTGRRVAPPLFGTLSILGPDVVLSRLGKAIEMLAAN